MATPMYDAFTGTPDVDGTRYDAVAPQQSIKELNTPASADAKLSQTLPFDRLDLVPQAILDRILWHSVHGADSIPPPPGPNASILEHERALGALAVLRRGGDMRKWLEAATGVDGDEGEQPGGWGAVARRAARP
jgi:hypothetical protein